MTEVDKHIRKLSNHTLERMRKHCLQLLTERQPLNKIVGMKPYNMWVAVSREQTRRQIENNGPLLSEKMYE